MITNNNFRAGVRFVAAVLMLSAGANPLFAVSGDSYESGYGETGRIKEGKVSTRGGRYLTVWRRAADGEWKIIRNIVLP